MSYQAEVINSQPQVTVTSYTIAKTSDWSSDLCDCCEDCGICNLGLVPCSMCVLVLSTKSRKTMARMGLCGAFIPCILACKVAQDHNESCCLPFLPGAMLALRTSIRDKYNINGSICDDWLVMVCCPHCGLCQMAREQKMRS